VIGLDTNVIIRYLTQDDLAQAEKANELIDTQLSAKQPGFITLLSLVEVSWVLASCYHQGRHDILTLLHDLLTTKQLLVESADSAYLAIKRCRDHDGTDFSDALIAVLSEAQGCEVIYSFDKSAQKVGMTLL
jgi:predicted nucleic-acid-binding protein